MNQPPNYQSIEAVRTDFLKLVESMSGLMKLGSDPLEQFTIPVGPHTVATVTFKGPISADAVDELIAYLNTVRQYAEARDPEVATAKDVVRVITDAADRIVTAHRPKAA